MRASYDAAESAYSWAACTKNPGHENFIPISEFKMNHLPKSNQQDSVLDCVRNVAQCTGRLRVTYTSWARPDNYTFSVARRTKIRVSKAKGRCPCPDIKGHDLLKEWWKVKLQTACHVVFDTEEAKASRVDLYFDDEQASLDGRM